jgi:VanZ family protein
VLRSRVPAVLWAALTALLLLTPGDSLPSDLWLLDVLSPEIMELLTHSVLFFVQAVLLVPVWRSWGLVSFFSLFYALVLELLQIPVPGRGFGWVDLVADAVGILLAWVVLEARR